MNERYKLPIPLAALFAFVAFGVSFVTTFIILLLGRWRLSIGQAAREIDSYEISESLIAKISFFVAIGAAAFVFRFLRSKVSYTAVFHTCFLTGLALLGYSAWILPFIIRLLNSGLERIKQMHGGWVALGVVGSNALIISMWIIPTALLLLAFATLYDNRTPRKSRCQSN